MSAESISRFLIDIPRPYIDIEIALLLYLTSTHFNKENMLLVKNNVCLNMFISDNQNKRTCFNMRTIEYRELV